MRDEMNRTIFAVIEDGDGWCVESNGQVLDRRADKDEAKAAAHRRARNSQDAGKACMVRVSGEHGFATKTDRDRTPVAPVARPEPVKSMSAVKSKVKTRAKA